MATGAPRVALVALTLLAACATPSGDSGRRLEAPYLHPTARLVLPEQILGIRASDLHEHHPRDVSANYRAPGVLLTVSIYPVDVVPGASLEDHFQAALAAIHRQWGVETARHLHLSFEDGDPRGPALAAVFEADRSPLVFGVLSVYAACSHIVKFRLSSDDTLNQERRFEILDAALDAVLPKDFALRALRSFDSSSCEVEVLESTDSSHASADGCQVFWNPASGFAGLHQALCEALDAKVAAGVR